MRILWITNIALPPVCEAMGIPAPSVGGWMYSSLKKLKETDGIVCAVATVYNGKEFIVKAVDGVRYYMLPLQGHNMTEYNKHLESFWLDIKADFAPDVVHIHGTEYPHGLAYVRACGTAGVVVSLQGIISSIARYYAGGIDYENVKKCLTLRDFVKRGGILKGQKEFERLGRFEIELLGKVKNIIGRTAWDKTHSWAVNPEAAYYHVGETLRDSFYEHKWNYAECEPCSIFVSQASYPIKGLHKMLEAMPLILREFPGSKIYVAGFDPTSRPWYLLTSYGKLLKKLISENNLKDKVIFTGMLDEKSMCDRYLRSNVFVCCSAIENSPNSLGEAQLLGMPHVASFVGGVPEIVNYNPDILYRFEETEMLAKKVCNVFAKADSYEAPKFNTRMYDSATNRQQLLEAYKAINS